MSRIIILVKLIFRFIFRRSGPKLPKVTKPDVDKVKWWIPLAELIIRHKLGKK